MTSRANRMFVYVALLLCVSTMLFSGKAIARSKSKQLGANEAASLANASHSESDTPLAQKPVSGSGVEIPEASQTVNPRTARVLIASLGNSGRDDQTQGSVANSQSKTEKEPEGDDPDVPSFLKGKIAKDDYLRLRQEFINRLRGIEPGKPYNPEWRRNAIKIMDHQERRRNLKRAGLNPDANEASTNDGSGTGTGTDTSGNSQPSTPQGPNSGPAWVELGPNPIPNGQTQSVTSSVSGRTVAIAIHPADPNILYVGTAQGGVYRSLDGGASWVAIFDTAQSLAIGALTLAPNNLSTLWVGTGEPNGSADSFAGVGLYRIDNADTSPAIVGPFNPVRSYLDPNNNPVNAAVFTGRAISKILAPATDPNTLFVGTAGGVMGIGGDAPFGGTVPPLGLRGLYRLSNVTGDPSATTVLRVKVAGNPTIAGCFDNPCTGNRNVNDMVFDPADSSGNTIVLWLNGLSTAGDGGIYRSTNASSASPTFIQTFATTSASTSNGRGALAIYLPPPGPAGQPPSVVYTANGEPRTGTSCLSSSQSGALRKSVDGGVTWSAKLSGGGGFCDGQCFYNIGFDLVPGSSPTTDKLLLGGNVRGGNSCQRQEATSLDGGTTFTDHDTGTHADTHFIKVAPSNPNIVFRGDDGGIWKSIDGGDTWFSLNNSAFRATQFQSIALHPTDPDFSIGGTQDNGTNLLTTGPTWKRIDFGDGGYSAIDQNAPDTTNVVMYHTYFNQTNNLVGYARVLSIASASDGLWSFKSSGISISDNVNFYAPLVLGPNAADSAGTNTVYYGTDRLYRSASRGDSSTLVSQAPILGGVPISSIAISQQDDNYRFVGLDTGGLFYTTTGSSTLTSLDPVGTGSAIPDRYVGRVKFDPTDKNTVYVCLGGFNGGTAPSQSHVWKASSLNGTPVLTGINGSGANVLPDLPVNGFAVDTNDPTNPGVSVLYSGTDIGVYQSVDGGANWVPLGSGLPRVAVFDMGIPNGKRVLRVATHGRGMWEIGLPTAPPVPVIVAAGSTLSNESCSPANGQIDPGERATVNLQLTNTGTAATSNLVATMQTSGGVVAPSGPVSYGVIAQGATQGRDFTFTADPSLVPGSTITATLLLLDDSNNLGSVTFTFIAGPSPCGGIRLTVVSTLVRSSSTKVQAQITVQNSGTLPADNVTLTNVKLGTTVGTPLPMSLGSISPGASAVGVVSFTNSTPGAGSSLTINGTYTGGTFSGARRLVIP